MMSEKIRKLSKVWKFSSVAKLFWLYFCAPKTKSTSQARNFVNFRRPEPGPNPTETARPDLQLWWQHDSIKFAYVVSNRLNYLVSPAVRMCLCQAFAVAWRKRCVFKSRIRLIGLNFLLSIQRYLIWCTKERKLKNRPRPIGWHW